MLEAILFDLDDTLLGNDIDQFIPQIDVDGDVVPSPSP